MLIALQPRGTLQAPRELVQPGRPALDGTGHSTAASVRGTEHADLAFNTFRSIERYRFHDHHTAHGIGAILNGSSAFDHRKPIAAERIDERSMFGAPLLIFLADAVVEHQNAVSVQAMDHRFGDMRTGLHDVHSGDPRKHVGDILSGGSFDLGRVHFHAHLAHVLIRPFPDHLQFLQFLGVMFQHELHFQILTQIDRSFDRFAPQVRHPHDVLPRTKPIDREFAPLIGHITYPQGGNEDLRERQRRTIVLVDHASAQGQRARRVRWLAKGRTSKNEQQ